MTLVSAVRSLTGSRCLQMPPDGRRFCGVFRCFSVTSLLLCIIISSHSYFAVGQQLAPVNCSFYSLPSQHCYVLATLPTGTPTIATWQGAVNYCRKSSIDVTGNGVTSVEPGQLVSIYDVNIETVVESLLQSTNQRGPVWIGATLENSTELISNPQSLWRWVQACPKCNVKTACSAKGQMDLAFVIDNSASNPISNPDWIRVVNFAVYLLKNVAVSSTGVRVAVVDSSGVKLHLNANQSAGQVGDLMLSLTSSRNTGRTITDSLYDVMNSVFVGSTSGDRLDVANVVIVIATNSQTHVDEDLRIASTLLQFSGIEVFSVGVSGISDENVLATVSSPPGVNNNTYFVASSFASLNNSAFANNILYRICRFHRNVISMTRTATIDQGCMLDWSASRDLTVDMTSKAGAVTPSSCLDTCSKAGFTYAGLQDGDSCFCGDEFGRYGTTSSCTNPCVQDPTKICGGNRRNTIYRYNGTYVNWSYNQPSNLDGYQWCGAIDQLINSTFDDQACQFDYRFICQLPPGNCSSSQHQTTTTAYVVVSGMCLYISPTMETWFRARQTCLEMGGDLVVINSEWFRLNVVQTLAVLQIVDRYIWIGLYRLNYIWSDEIGSGTEMTYNNFALRQPVQSDGSSDLRCIYMDPRYGYQWYTSNCSLTYNFVCQYKFSALPISSLTTPWFIGLMIAIGLLLIGIIVLAVIMGLAARSRRMDHLLGPKALDVRPEAPKPRDDALMHGRPSQPPLNTRFEPTSNAASQA